MRVNKLSPQTRMSTDMSDEVYIDTIAIDRDAATKAMGNDLSQYMIMKD